MAFTSDVRLALGDPATELIRVAEEQAVDLIAMSTHGHRFLADLLHGPPPIACATSSTIPVLLFFAP